jgi:hypothetical protein
MPNKRPHCAAGKRPCSAFISQWRVTILGDRPSNLRTPQTASLHPRRDALGEPALLKTLILMQILSNLLRALREIGCYLLPVTW